LKQQIGPPSREKSSRFSLPPQPIAFLFSSNLIFSSPPILSKHFSCDVAAETVVRRALASTPPPHPVGVAQRQSHRRLATVMVVVKPVRVCSF